MEPKITVIMTAYNSSKHIGEAILSILDQTFKELELIVINDCSTDNTPEIVKQYAEEDSRVILLNNLTNLKPALSRNRALEIAKGEYIAILDSDDVALPNRFREQYDFLEKHPDVALVGCAAEIIDDDGKILGRKFYPEDFNEIKFMLLLRNPFVHSGILGRKRAMLEFGYSHDHLHSEDYKLYSDLIKKYKITNLGNILVRYRQSAGSVTLGSVTRQMQLANANKIHYDLINRYLPAAPSKVKIIIETLHKMRSSPFSLLNAVAFYRRLTLSYIEKEQPNAEIRKVIWNIYAQDTKMFFGQIFCVRLFQKLNHFYNHQFVKQTMMLQAGSFGGTIVQAVVGILIARLLQPELLGVYSLAFGLAATTSLIIGMGIQEAASSLLGKSYAQKDNNEVENILGFMFKITFLAALIVLVFSFFLPNIADKLYGNSVVGFYAAIIIAAVTLSSFFFTLTYSAFQVTGRIKSLTYLIITDQSLRSGLSLVLVIAGFGVWGVVSGHLIGALMIFILSALLFRNLTRRDLVFPDLRRLIMKAGSISLKKYFGFTFWVALDRNMSNLFMALPIILTGIYVTVSEVSFFKLAFGYVNLALSLLGPISVLLNVEFPKLRIENREKLAENFKKVSLYSLGLSILLTVAAVIVSPLAFKTLYGENFLPSVPYVAGLIVYGVLYGIGVGLGPMWRAINKVKVSILINSVILGVGIPLGLWLIKNYGLWGSVVMVTVWFSVSHIVSFIYLIRKLKRA